MIGANGRGVPLATSGRRNSFSIERYGDCVERLALVRTHLRSVIGQLGEERRLTGTIAAGASGACSRLCMRRGTRMGLLALARTAGSEDALEGEIFIAAEIGNP
jgi:hypothetical protein